MKRNMGIEILRILSMCGIVGLHVMNAGGILANIPLNSYKYYLVLAVITVCYTSVNIFALISGYLYIDKENTKKSRIVELLFILFFYSVAIFLVFYVFNLYDTRYLGFKSMVEKIFPVLFDRYWYIVCYIFLFFMIPYINKFIKSIEKKELKKMLIILFILLSILPNVFGLVDFFRIKNGYSPFWLIYLYMIGAYIKLYLTNTNETKNKYMSKIFGYLFLSYLLNALVKITTFKTFGKIVKAEWFINYISPFIVLASIYLVIYFKNLKMKNSEVKYKLISLLSSYAFSVYIIHGNLLIFENIFTDKFVFLNNYNGILLIMGIFGIIILTYFICMLIDMVRKWIFKIFKIDDLIHYIGDWVEKTIIKFDKIKVLHSIE